MIRIHHLQRSRSFRIVWQCEEMGLPYEIAPVSWPPNEAYRKINPVGSVPYLEDLRTGAALNESVAMMLYLATEYGPTPLMPGKGDPSMARAYQFLIFGEASLGSSGNVLVGAKFLAPEEHKSNWSVGDARRRLMQCFSYAAESLGDRPFLAGDAFTLADISVGFVLGTARSSILDMEKDLPPALLAYHDRLKGRPAYQRAAAK